MRRTPDETFERKQAEEALRESEERYRALFDRSLDCVYIHDFEGNFIDANDAALKLFRYTKEEILSLNFGTLLTEEQIPTAAQTLEELKEKGYQRDVTEFRLKDKEGNDIHVETIAAVIYHGTTPYAVQGIARDITERKLAEEGLRESEERYRGFFENSTDFVYTLDLKGNFTDVNKAAESLTGYTKKELIGMNYRDYATVDSHEKIFQAFHRIFEEGEPTQDFPFEVTVKDGAKKYFETSVGPLRKGRKIIGFHGTSRDITHRVHSEQVLRRSEEKYRNIFNNAQVGIFRTRISDGKVIECNDRFARTYGYKTPEECIDDFVVSERYTDSGVREKMVASLMEKGEVNDREACFSRKDGEDVWIRFSARAYPEEAYLEGVGYDITEEKKALEALRESEQRFKEMADLLPTIVCEIGMDLRVTYANSLAFEKTGFTQSDFEAGISAMDLLNPGDREKAAKRIQQTLKGVKLESVEYGIYKKDGSLFPVLLNSAPIYKDGQITGIRFSMADMAEQKKLERQLQQAQKMEAIGTLAGGVAHDLNNILSGLVSYPELLLLQLAEDNPLRKSILTIQKSGEKAAAVVLDLLTLARRGVVVTDVVNLNDVISEYLKSPEYEKLQSYHPGVHLETHLTTDTLNILGSSTHLYKAVMNLVSNAAEAMPVGGKIIVTTENRYIDRPIRGYDNVKEGDYVVFTISDTGTGISPEDIEKIFEPFYTKKKMGRSGTGLGMAVVWGTVKDHNGYIDIQSTEGKGTTFTLYFPVTRKGLPEDDSHLAIETYRGNGESLLIVDDVEEQRKIASGMLKELGYSVVSVSSGEEAVEYLKTNKVDLLVLDMIMDPGMDGLDTYKNILELHPGQKAIIASGFSETDRVKQVQSLGAGAYIRKPYTLAKIGIAVKEELEK